MNIYEIFCFKLSRLDLISFSNLSYHKHMSESDLKIYFRNNKKYGNIGYFPSRTPASVLYEQASKF